MARTDRPARTPFACATLGAAWLLSSPSAPAQSAPLVQGGFASRVLVTERGAPWRVRGLAVLDGTDEIAFAVGSTLYRTSASGPPTPFRITQGGGDVSFVVRPRAQGSLYYGEFATAILVVHDLLTGSEVQHALPANTFDLETTLGGTVLAVANPAWPAPGAASGVHVVASGTPPREIIRLVGPSGPLLIDRLSGDLFCAVLGAGVPPPRGSVQIRRFTSLQLTRAIAGGPLLTLADSSLFAAGLDGAFDLAQDDRGAVYVSDPTWGDVRRIDARGVLDPGPLIARNASASLDLAFVDGGEPSFDPWQPGDGAALFCTTTDFVTAASIAIIRAAAPVLDSPQAPRAPRGPVRFDATGLPPTASAFLLLDFLPAIPRRAIARFGGVALFTDLDFTILPLATPLTVDPAGRATLTLTNPGGFNLPLTLATFGGPDPASGVFAMSPGLAITLLP